MYTILCVDIGYTLFVYGSINSYLATNISICLSNLDDLDSCNAENDLLPNARMLLHNKILRTKQLATKTCEKSSQEVLLYEINTLARSIQRYDRKIHQSMSH